MVDLKDTKRIEQLMHLFRGSNKARGMFIETISKDPLKPKTKGKAATIPQGPTLKHWTDHYYGNVGLGIIPITEEDMCYWGVLDVDGNLNPKAPAHAWPCLNKDGTVDHIKLQEEIQKNQLPLVCCYSKSKSAHCFLFVEEAIPASSMRSLLEEMASKLGVGGCEIFPKQDKLDKTRGDLGNWLNMPYFGNTRLGILLTNGTLVEQDIDTFLSFAIQKRLTNEQLGAFTNTLRTDIDTLEEVLEGAPPCIQHILHQGIPDGTRNITLFNIAIYCRKKYGENFREEFAKLHERFVDEPLSFRELENICSSVEKKDYNYQCKDPVLKRHCNANICRDKDYGIDFSSEIKSLKSATRILTDPVVYAIEVEMEAGLPHVLYVETDQLFSQDQFRKECSYQLHKTFVPIKLNDWNETCVRLINTAVNQEPPYEMTVHGQLFRHLQNYLVNRAQYKKVALSEEEGVFHDIDKHFIYFRLDGFKAYLVRKGVYAQSLSRWKLSQLLENLQIPTEEVNLETGLCTYEPLNIKEERLRINKGFVTTRSVPDHLMKLEEIISITEEGDVV